MRRRELSRREKKTGWKRPEKRTAAKKRRSFIDRTDENQFSVKAFMSSSVRFSLAELAVMVTA